MTKAELLQRLQAIKEADNQNLQDGHVEADGLLLAYIKDPEIAEAYNAIGKWFA